MNKPKLIIAILMMFPLVVVAAIGFWGFLVSLPPNLIIGSVIVCSFFVGGKLLGEALDGN